MTVGTISNRRAIVAWCLYDWANSAFPTIVSTFLFSAYVTEAVAPDRVTGTALWGQAMSVAGIAIALSSPALGAIADSGGRRKAWLFGLSALCVAATALLWFVRPTDADLVYALVMAAIATVGFELAIVFYNALLPGLAPAGRLGRISGWGWGVGYFGGLGCLVIALLVFVRPELPPFGLDKAEGEHVRVAMLLAAAWFAVFALPLFLWVPEPDRGRAAGATAVRAGFSNLIATFREIRRHANVARFLLAKLVYMEGLNTTFAFGGIYAAGAIGMTLEEVLLFGILLNVSGGIGAILFAWVDDWIGAKPTIMISLAALAVLAVPMLLVTDKFWFTVIGMGLGIFFGPVQAASRSLMARLAPPGQVTEFFGFYSLAGKASAIVGPALVGWLTFAFDSQRIGMAAVPVFFVVGLLLLLPVREKAAPHAKSRKP